MDIAADPIPAPVLALHRDIAAAIARVPVLHVPPAVLALHRSLGQVVARMPVLHVPPAVLALHRSLGQVVARMPTVPVATAPARGSRPPLASLALRSSGSAGGEGDAHDIAR